MSEPPKTPYGALIEQAREQAGLSRREAAKRAGISDSWWKYVVEGRQGSTPVPGTPDTVANMALVVGLDPGDLESQGGRADAAALMRDPRRSLPAPSLAPAPEPRPDAGEEQAERDYDRLFRAVDPRDVEVLQILGRAVDGDGRPYSWQRKLQIAEEYLRRSAASDNGASGTA